MSDHNKWMRILRDMPPEERRKLLDASWNVERPSAEILLKGRVESEQRKVVAKIAAKLREAGFSVVVLHDQDAPPISMEGDDATEAGVPTGSDTIGGEQRSSDDVVSDGADAPLWLDQREPPWGDNR